MTVWLGGSPTAHVLAPGDTPVRSLVWDPTRVCTSGLPDTIRVGSEFPAARLPHSQLATIGAGHFVSEEAPDAFAALIADWVTEGYQRLETKDATPAGMATHAGMFQ